MNTTLDHIAPEIVQAIIAQATARGLSVNDYLRHLLGLDNGAGAELALSEEPQQRHKEKPQRNSACAGQPLRKGDIRKFFGVWKGGDANGSDNEQIDRDLARAYAQECADES
jgi:hypothetical protein